jgi:TldD protein
MRDLAEAALDAARSAGAGYADARIVYQRTRTLVTRNGRMAAATEAESEGIGVRVLASGAWGFAATNEMTRDAVTRTAARAVELARAAAGVRRQPVALALEGGHVARWESTCIQDPFAIPLDRMADLMLRADAEMARVAGVTLTEVGLTFTRSEQLFLSTAGSDIHQVRTHSGAGLAASAFADGDLQKRSYPNSFGGQYQLRGFEMVEALDLPGHAGRTAEEAVALLAAPECPSGVMDVILDPTQLALQIHESIGHPSELDRVFGMEANYAGTSFLTPDWRGKPLASAGVTIVADARAAHGPGLGTFAFDDEGVPAQGTFLVEDGIFRDYLSSRETAATLGDPASSGTMRAESWNRAPLIRMTNVSLLPGPWTPEALIEDTTDGLYLKVNKSWSIDDRRLDFQFGTEAAWEVKNGRLGRLLKNPTYGGRTPEFWASCDGIGSDWELWGVPNCGKGQPSQTMGVSHGAPTARFRKVRVGVTR